MNMTPKKAACVVICAVLLATLGAGCTQSSNQTTPSGGITVTDDAGRNVTIAQTPHRIISLAPSITEDLFALGLGNKVVGVDSYSDYPQAALNITKVGGFSTPSVEKIISVNPDIVFASNLSASVIPTLAADGIPTVVLNPTSLTGILNDLSLIGNVTSSTGNSSALVANLTQRMVNVENLPIVSHPRMLYLVYWNPAYTAANDTYENSIVTAAGGTNIAAQANLTGYPTMSKESIIALNPQIIVCNGGMNSTAIQQVKSDPTLSNLDAVKNGKVYIVNSDIISHAGPRAFDVLDWMAAILREPASVPANASTDLIVTPTPTPVPG